MRKRVIWLEYYYDYHKQEVHAALRQLLVKYPGMDMEIHRNKSGSLYYVRLEIPKDLSDRSEESILEGMNINYSLLWSYTGEMFNYLRNTPKYIEYDESATKEILK